MRRPAPAEDTTIVAQAAAVANPIYIVTAADDRFVLGLAVALTSLSHTQRRACAVFVLHDALAPALRTRIERSVSSNTEITWIQIDNAWCKRVQLPAHLGVPTVYRLFAPDVLPKDVTRAIYLDADVLVRSPLDDLWETKLVGGDFVAAVRNGSMPWAATVTGLPWRDLGLQPDTPYFTAGVLVMNINAWREENLGARVVDLLRDHSLPFGDQDALNVLCVGRWRNLHPRWNLTQGLLTQGLVGQLELPLIIHGESACREALEDPAIVHYNGPAKPWMPACTHPQRELWFEWLDRTPWRGWRPERRGVVSRAFGRVARATRILVSGR